MASHSTTSVHDFTVKDARGNDVDLSVYKGKVLLIVNVASQCGLTNSNYTELSQLYEKYKDQENFQESADAILEKCDGLPLAIVSIIGVLASKQQKARREWKDILRHLGSQLDYNPNIEEMKQILNFSYNNLLYHIKRYFLYMSKFPEDYLIDRKRIKRL